MLTKFAGMCEVVFPNVANKYIPTINILGGLTEKQHIDLPFYSIVADSENRVGLFDQQQYPILLVVQLGVEKLPEMSFKYAITKFCMALRPFACLCPSKQHFDPAIYIFNRLSLIFDWLKDTYMHMAQNQIAGLVPHRILLIRETPEVTGLHTQNGINSSEFEGGRFWFRRAACRGRRVAAKICRMITTAL